MPDQNLAITQKVVKTHGRIHKLNNADANLVLLAHFVLQLALHYDALLANSTLTMKMSV